MGGTNNRQNKIPTIPYININNIIYQRTNASAEGSIDIKKKIHWEDRTDAFIGGTEKRERIINRTNWHIKTQSQIYQ